jgi:GTP pyrophosphokinase
VVTRKKGARGARSYGEWLGSRDGRRGRLGEARAALYNRRMVSVVHSVAAQSDHEQSLQTLCEGLSAEESALIRDAAVFAREYYGEHTLGSGEGVWSHALGMALILVGLRLDADSRLAALLFAVPSYDERGVEHLEARFGRPVSHLVSGIWRLNRLRPITRDFVADAAESPQEMKAQIEVLRKMLLAMVEDIRVVLLRLASRTQTLRHYAANPHDLRAEVARETLEIYSPLANRLGVWELKWELEDLSFRFLHPDTYKKIAKQLDEKRAEREQFITDAIARLRSELAAAGVANAEVYGRPKHIYSIWNKMRKKGVDFAEVYDVRALRVIVDDIKECYTALGIVHNIWTPIPKEFDDYISNPKGNNYRSLHTAVRCPDGRSLEVQIRTWDMHKHAELGVAAHWRYKEGARKSEDNYDEKIAWLRQLLTWKDEVSDSSDWVAHYKQAALDETIYVMTPQGRVVDLPRGATPVDFAYRVHTDLGHRCRGAKVDGVLVPLNTALETGQRVEIMVARDGGPSRDWLNPSLGYLFTQRARSKVRTWFANLALEQTLADGRAVVMKELQRLGHTKVNIDDLAVKLGFAKSDDLFIAAGRNELGLRQFQAVVRGDEAPPDERPAPEPRRKKTPEADRGILIVGVDKLLTQLARCCKPAPPDEIHGFVTRGKGVSIHRVDCPNFANLAALHPERVIETDWGGQPEGAFPVDIVVDAHDRQGLLRDVSDVFAREKLNVIAVNTQSKQGKAHMGFTVEISDLQQLKRTLAQVHEVAGVVGVRRA